MFEEGNILRRTPVRRKDVYLNGFEVGRNIEMQYRTVVAMQVGKIPNTRGIVNAYFDGDSPS